MTKLTRQHFRAFAEEIATIPDDVTRREVANLIGTVCRRFNGSFSWTRWLEACRATPRPVEPRQPETIFD